MGRKHLSKSKRYDVLRRDGFRCVYCGATAGDVEIHIDHKVPVAEGGSNKIENLVTACRPCNLGKGTKPAEPPLGADQVVDGVKLRFHPRVNYRHTIESRLWLYYEVEGESITDDYTPDQIGDVDLLRRWVSRSRERYGDDAPVPIDWYVDAPSPLGVERMPPHHTRDFLTHFTQPEHPLTGERVPFEALPARQKRWSPGRTFRKGGFIQEALGWTPEIRQPGVSVAGLHSLARKRLGEARNLDERMAAAAALHAFRPSGRIIQPLPANEREEIEFSYGDEVAHLDLLEAAGDPGPIL